VIVSIPATVTDVRVCFIGDSYVAGAGDPDAHGWVGRATSAAIRQGMPITAYNLGIRGQTGPEVASRIEVETRPRFAPAEDARLVVSFGANDTVERNGHRRASAAESVAALRTIVARSAAPVFMIGPPAVDEDRQNDRLDALNAAFAAATADLNVPYLELFDLTERSALWREEIAQGDGYHPGAAGYQLLADHITPPLLTWLAAPAPTAEAV
jgi:acyl-CoA thioesterase I